MGIYNCSLKISGLELVCKVNILYTETSSLRTLKITPRHLNENCTFMNSPSVFIVAWMCWSVQHCMYCTPCLTSYHLSSPKIFHYGHSSHSCNPLPFYACFQLGFPLLSKKIFCGRRTRWNGPLFCRIQPVSRNKKLSIPSHSAEEKRYWIFLQIIPKLEFFHKRKLF